jgi:hypothetical protein
MASHLNCHVNARYSLSGTSILVTFLCGGELGLRPSIDQKTNKIHVEDMQEHHFLRIKKANAKNISKGLGWRWGALVLVTFL